MKFTAFLLVSFTILSVGLSLGATLNSAMCDQQIRHLRIQCEVIGAENEELRCEKDELLEDLIKLYNHIEPNSIARK